MFYVYKDFIECDEALSMLAKKKRRKTPILKFSLSPEQCELWREEQCKRYAKFRKHRVYNGKVFDVDESMEIGIFSLEHFKEIFKFITKNANEQAKNNAK